MDRQQLVGAAAHEHDVHQALADIVADQLAVLVQRAEAALPGMVLGAPARRGDAVGHVGVLRVGGVEVLARAVGEDAGDLLVERLLHGLACRGQYPV